MGPKPGPFRQLLGNSPDHTSVGSHIVSDAHYGIVPFASALFPVHCPLPGWQNGRALTIFASSKYYALFGNQKLFGKEEIPKD